MARLLRCPECGHETVNAIYIMEGTVELRKDGMYLVPCVDEEELASMPDDVIKHFSCEECGHLEETIDRFVDTDEDEQGEYDYERAADAALERQEMEDFAQDDELHNMSAEDIL